MPEQNVETAERLVEAWIVARFREGKIYKVEFYLDREQAMRACGRTT